MMHQKWDLKGKGGGSNCPSPAYNGFQVPQQEE